MDDVLPDVNFEEVGEGPVHLDLSGRQVHKLSKLTGWNWVHDLAVERVVMLNVSHRYIIRLGPLGG